MGGYPDTQTHTNTLRIIMPIQDIHSTVMNGVRIVEWTLLDGEVGTPYRFPGTTTLACFLGVHSITGSPTVTFEVSPDGVNWFPAIDYTGAAISIDSSGSVEFSTAALYVRASCSGGGATVSMNTRG